MGLEAAYYDNAREQDSILDEKINCRASIIVNIVNEWQEFCQTKATWLPDKAQACLAVAILENSF